MFPDSIFKHSKDRLVTDPVSAGQSSAPVNWASVTVLSPYLYNVFFGKSSCMDLFPFNLATFSVPVNHVVNVCTEKKVVRIDTIRIIALMQDTESIGNRAVMESPRVPMSFYLELVQRKGSIASSECCSRPSPAPTILVYGANLVDLSPEALLGGDDREFGSALAVPPDVMFSAQASSYKRSRTSVNGALDVDVRSTRHDSTPSVVPKKKSGKLVGFQPFGCTALAA